MSARPMATCRSESHVPMPFGRAVMATFLTVLALAVLHAAAARAADSVAPRGVMDLGGPWRATLDVEDKGEREGYFKPDFAAQGW